MNNKHLRREAVMPWNVGVLGAGPGVAALHLPVLGGLDELFRVVHIADAGSGQSSAKSRWPPAWKSPKRSLPHAGPPAPASWWEPITCLMQHGGGQSIIL